MRHDFTLLLPEEYRCKGSDLVAVSVFGGEWSGESVRDSDAIAKLWNALDTPPTDKDLMPVWRHRNSRHTQEFRMEDLVGEPYAVIWLTRAEFDGPLCDPPIQRNNTSLRSNLLPRWTEIGSASAYVEQNYSATLDRPPEDYHIVRMLGGLPAKNLPFHRALKWTPRANDPNAGVPPPEGDLFGQTSEQGYQSIWSEEEDCNGYPVLHGWADAHTENHIGGTMRPVQAHPVPPFSPFYIGFTEVMGGFNFGGGTAQLDLDQMRIDWACG
jgi:hypothetical protein